MRALDGVRELRERRMLTQQELAERAGVSLFTVQRIERGEGSVRPKTGRAIAGALGVRVEDLLGKAQAPLPDFEDAQRQAQETAVENALLLRQRGRGQLRGLIDGWKASKEHGEPRSSRRGYLDGIEKLLDEARSARQELVRAFFRFEGLSPQARQGLGEGEGYRPDWDWDQVREADRFYLELIDMVRREPDFRVEEHETGPPKVEAA